VLQAYEERHVVELVLGGVWKANPDDERFQAKITVLRKLIEHHVEAEEKKMFNVARKLEHADLEALGAETTREAERASGTRKGWKAA
jgi:hemerythrin superfamily protein